MTTKVAERSDWWFHVKNQPGSHVVLASDGEADEPTERDFTQAAEIAAYYSKAAGEQNTAVDYTFARHVKKPAGGKPGLVIYHTNWTAYVSPKAEEIQQSSTLGETDDIDAQLEEAVRIDKEMRDLLDWAFAAPVSDVVFGDSFCFTTSGGVTAMEQFLAGVMPLVEEAFKAEVSAAKERQDKYLSKYRK